MRLLTVATTRARHAGRAGGGRRSARGQLALGARARCVPAARRARSPERRQADAPALRRRLGPRSPRRTRGTRGPCGPGGTPRRRAATKGALLRPRGARPRQGRRGGPPPAEDPGPRSQRQRGRGAERATTRGRRPRRPARADCAFRSGRHAHRAERGRGDDGRLLRRPRASPRAPQPPRERGDPTESATACSSTRCWPGRRSTAPTPPSCRRSRGRTGDRWGPRPRIAFASRAAGALEHELLGRARASTDARREVGSRCARPTGGWSGVVDLAFQEADGSTVVDFKTDVDEGPRLASYRAARALRRSDRVRDGRARGVILLV